MGPSVPWRGSDLLKVKSHFTTQTLPLCEVLVFAFEKQRKGMQERLTIIIVEGRLSKLARQCAKYKILRSVQFICLVSSCVTINENVSPSRSGSSLWQVICGSGNPPIREYMCSDVHPPPGHTQVMTSFSSAVDFRIKNITNCHHD